MQFSISGGAQAGTNMLLLVDDELRYLFVQIVKAGDGWDCRPVLASKRGLEELGPQPVRVEVSARSRLAILRKGESGLMVYYSEQPECTVLQEYRLRVDLRELVQLSALHIHPLYFCMLLKEDQKTKLQLLTIKKNIFIT